MNVVFRQLIDEYLEQVCLPVKAKDMHPEIRLEIEAHMEAIIVDLLAEGIPEEVAVEKAIAQMGDPHKLGIQFHKVHKPLTDWNLIVLVALLLITGLVAMLAMKTAATPVIGTNLLEKSLFYGAVGLLLLTAINFWDYRKLHRWSFFLYLGTAAVLLFFEKFGSQINGVRTWFPIASIPLNVSMISLYTFILAIAGMMASKPDPLVSILERGENYVKEMLLYLMIPAMLYSWVSTTKYFILYMISLSVLLLISGRWRTWLSYAGILSACAFVLLIRNDSRFEYLKARTFSYLAPSSYPNESYMTVHSREAVRSAGLWGNGFGVSTAQIPNISNSMIFTYLIYSLGWLMGVMIAMLVGVLIVRVWRMAKEITDPYGKKIIVGLFALITAQFVWNMLMSVGLMPIMDITLPFIGYGGFDLVLNLAVIGLILNVYRRKNMIPSYAV